MELIKKVQSMFQAWNGKLLSFGGKAILINSVMQSVPMYQLSMIIPLKCVLHDLRRIFARFLWNFKEEGNNKYWVAWDETCLPKKRGGGGRLDFSPLFEVSRDLFAKL